MPTVWMFCGLPGAGKSYLVDYIISRQEFDGIICSSDAVIDEISNEYGLTYDDCFKDLNDFAVKQYNREVRQCVSRGWDIIMDQTNLTAKSRARKLAAIPKSYKRVAVVVPTHITDPARWRAQLERPGKTIPEDVIDQMIQNFEPPTSAEGFDQILYPDDL